MSCIIATPCDCLPVNKLAYCLPCCALFSESEDSQSAMLHLSFISVIFLGKMGYAAFILVVWNILRTYPVSPIIAMNPSALSM